SSVVHDGRGAIAARHRRARGDESRVPRRTVRLTRVRNRRTQSVTPAVRRHRMATHSKQTPSGTNKPNILFIMSDDIGWFNVSAYNLGIMGYRTPNIDRIAQEGALFTDFYGQQSCTAGRAAFITGQSPIRTGLTKVGLPGAQLGLSAEDPSIGQF